ncbi:MAG: site-specific DNA-methyltransferase [Acidimicrobiales bacterium]|nr:site-specific DNA-methyltransferase [Acidimicrobiales bacterium]MXX43591.1 site-specific DNA-methyltransferase [Acidimicrobiales bacterium]MYB82161.1 site-specific DNA-methyltransferase [Acidimicrobiales bacterium]MYD33856.1 site-specific DNA-methyltransferase [Acidimicrobiales bacterium]MYI09847.1 site-specific DNA-methyltransferase [Acidimicrobiales bacterium]
MAKRAAKSKAVETLTHDDSTRLNIPTAEFQTQRPAGADDPLQVAYERRNRDLDPQLVWRGKDTTDWADLVVQAPPLYIQEKVHPKSLIEDLRQASAQRSVEQAAADAGFQIELFSDFNGLTSADAKTEFYQHQMNWSNRMILGDSLQVMASLAEREGLRGKVQCIYLDPPYGIKFNSNFQWSTTSRDVRDGKADHITREPEQVRAFRDTWRDGIHSYLTYLRDRLTVARDLLTDSGSVFVQIGDENVHRVRSLMDEVFGVGAFVAQVTFRVKSPLGNSELARTSNFILWYARNPDSVKFRELRALKLLDEHSEFSLAQLPEGQIISRAKLDPADLADSVRYFTAQNLGSSGYTDSCMFDFSIQGRTFRHPRGKSWKTNQSGMGRLACADRLHPLNRSLRWRYFLDDAPGEAITDVWRDTFAAHDKTYVVQTSTSVVQRCLLMTTDPGDLVLDPTCGAGTTAYVAEQWGRRWITIDTSRVALALARTRLMGGRYPYYLLADSPEGQQKEADLSRIESRDAPSHRDVRQGFVYERVPHITLRSIANNTEIDVIYEQRQPAVEAALADLNATLRASPPLPFEVGTGGRKGLQVDFALSADATVSLPSGEEAPANGLLEWEVPRERPEDWPAGTADPHERFWQARLDRQRAIDESIAAKADFEYLYDKPYEDNSKVRVAGPFTVESISPHRYLGLDADDDLIDPVAEARSTGESPQDFVSIILDNLRAAGVQQAHKTDRIDFVSLQPWPGDYICAEGTFVEGSAASPDGLDADPEARPSTDSDDDVAANRRAAIFIGSEFGTVTRPDLVAAAREAAEAGFDVLISCAFSYGAQASAFIRSGPMPVLKARMNADLHMAGELKSTGSGNLFVIFGEPDIELLPVPPDEPGPAAASTEDQGATQYRVRLRGIDVFDPTTGEVRSDETDGIACWFVDTDYDHESFFVRHAYFLGADDPYKSLKTTLRAEIDEDAWATLHSDTSRPFPAPETGHIAVKVINHLGDEVMKVFRVPTSD